MHRVEPKVILIAETDLKWREVYKYLDLVGGDPEQGGVFDPYDELQGVLTHSSPELLTEFMGRLCYRSWKPELNPNVTKVREGNDVYLDNVIKVKHGSVLEHAQVSFVFQDVSRVFTHELVRHRVGVGISQESLRFVRLDELGMWLPSCITDDERDMDCLFCSGRGDIPIWNEGLEAYEADSCGECTDGKVHAEELFEQTFRLLEQQQLKLAKHFKLDDPGVDFNKKKEITSAMRRIAPDGLATAIGWSANMRTLRFVLALRTHRSAEEEIRLVYDQVGKIASERWPNLFGDFKREEYKGIGEWTSPNWKI